MLLSFLQKLLYVTRRKALRRLGLSPGHLRSANTGRGAWRMARHPVLQTALNNAILRRHGFLLPSDLAPGGA
jgi:hypothetical protein